jgi:hypothetical protein
MNSFLQVLNKPLDAFRAGNKWMAWGLVALTILSNAIFEPLLRFFAGFQSHVQHPKIDLLHLLTITVFGVCTYLIICVAIWMVCKCLGSKTRFRMYLNTWGFTYFPTFLCSLVVAITEVFFYVFWNNMVWGMVLNILFFGILLWKTVLYVLYLREIAGFRRGKLLSAFLIIGIFIVLLAMANGYLGIKTPVL